MIFFGKIYFKFKFNLNLNLKLAFCLPFYCIYNEKKYQKDVLSELFFYRFFVVGIHGALLSGGVGGKTGIASIFQHYYPEGGWGILVLGKQQLTNKQTNLQTKN